MIIVSYINVYVILMIIISYINVYVIKDYVGL